MVNERNNEKKREVSDKKCEITQRDEIKCVTRKTSLLSYFIRHTSLFTFSLALFAPLLRFTHSLFLLRSGKLSQISFMIPPYLPHRVAAKLLQQCLSNFDHDDIFTNDT